MFNAEPLLLTLEYENHLQINILLFLSVGQVDVSIGLPTPVANPKFSKY